MKPDRVLIPIVLISLCSARARAQDLPMGPVEIRAEDAPNDDGTGIAVMWAASPGEREAADRGVSATAEYVISIAPDGPEPRPFVEAVRVPALWAWKRDRAESFGFLARFSKDHAVVVKPPALFPPRALAQAVLGDEDALGEARARWGDDAVARAKEILAPLHVTAAAELEELPGALDEIKWSVVLGAGYTLRLDARPVGATETGEVLGTVSGVRARTHWFNWMELNNLVVLVVLGCAIFSFIMAARRNPNFYLRRIGGLDAIDEALGRATEMGKPVLFVHGLEELKKVPTIAAINILGEVAKKVARYDTKLLCANYDSIVLTVSQETVKEGFLRAGRPDAYNQDDVFLAGAEQFSYVAAVDGIMIRQKPAANIYAGYFYAESLLLAETGAQTGAIQIAATDAYTQLPFFVTTCDYTLMGEELYAASAYLSRDPLLLGSLRGQDLGKLASIIYILAGTLELALGSNFLKLLVSS